MLSVGTGPWIGSWDLNCSVGSPHRQSFIKPDLSTGFEHVYLWVHVHVKVICIPHTWVDWVIKTDIPQSPSNTCPTKWTTIYVRLSHWLVPILKIISKSIKNWKRTESTLGCGEKTYLSMFSQQSLSYIIREIVGKFSSVTHSLQFDIDKSIFTVISNVFLWHWTKCLTAGSETYVCDVTWPSIDIGNIRSFRSS